MSTTLDDTQHTAPSPILAADTVPAAFQLVVAAYPDKVALRTVDGSTEITWREADTLVRRIAAGLAALGVDHGDSIAIVLPNTIPCHLVDFAAAHLGAVPFAVYNSSPAVQITHQLENSDARVIFTDSNFLSKVRAAAAALPVQIDAIVVVDAGEVADGVVTWDEFLDAGDPDFDLEERWQAVSADDPATIIYTSGTTGPPKGAQWSHRTALAQQRAMDAALPLPTENIISFLPMAHAGGKATCQHMALGYGATITVCPDMRDVPQALAAVHPDAFFSTPRLWEKLQVAIEASIQAEPDAERRAAMEQAVATGLEAVRAAERGSGETEARAAELAAAHSEALPHLKPVLARLGLDRIKAAYIGGAPSPGSISQFFRAVGVPLLEAYGLTEGCLNVFNRVDDFKSGTAGQPLPGVELRLADDGEILVKGDLNFIGYRKQPEATSQTLDEEGWLHTGDIAVVDDEGFVKIVDRKKEIIINAAGKNMSPVNIESAVRAESSLIGQAVAIGDGRRYVTALITLDPEAMTMHAQRLGLADADHDTLALSPELHSVVQEAVTRANEHLHNDEKVKKFAILPQVWVPDSEELTPTAKLKRRAIHAKHADAIESLYSE